MGGARANNDAWKQRTDSKSQFFPSPVVLVTKRTQRLQRFAQKFFTFGGIRGLTERYLFASFGMWKGQLGEDNMYRIFGSIAVAALLVGASAMSASATTCDAGCFGNTGVTNPNGFVIGDNAPTPTNIVDDFLFTLTSGKWSFSGDTITVHNGIIQNLELQLFNSSNVSLGSTTLYSIVGGNQVATLAFPDIPSIVHGGAYYLQVTGLGGAGLSFGGNLNSQFEGPDNLGAPLPAALPLFASGLGVLGFWGRRRKQKAA